MVGNPIDQLRKTVLASIAFAGHAFNTCVRCQDHISAKMVWRTGLGVEGTNVDSILFIGNPKPIRVHGWTVYAWMLKAFPFNGGDPLLFQNLCRFPIYCNTIHRIVFSDGAPKTFPFFIHIYNSIYIIWHAWWCQLWQLATVKNSSGFIFLTASIPAQLAQSLRKRQTLAFKKLVLRLSKISKSRSTS